MASVPPATTSSTTPTATVAGISAAAVRITGAPSSSATAADIAGAVGIPRLRPVRPHAVEGIAKAVRDQQQAIQRKKHGQALGLARVDAVKTAGVQPGTTQALPGAAGGGHVFRRCVIEKTAQALTAEQPVALGEQNAE